MVKVTLNLKGHIQGIFFRKDTKKEAEKLKLKGYVKNNVDGTVEVIAQGLKDKVDELVEYCIGGCERGFVEDVDIEYSDEEDDFDDFEIKD